MSSQVKAPEERQVADLLSEVTSCGRAGDPRTSSTELFNVVQSLRLEKLLLWFFCGVSERRKLYLSPFLLGKKHIWKTKQCRLFAKFFFLLCVLTSNVDLRPHVSPQTVCSQRDTWTVWQVRSYLSQEKKFTLQKAFVGQSLGALMMEFLNIFNNLAKSCDSQWK